MSVTLTKAGWTAGEQAFLSMSRGGQTLVMVNSEPVPQGITQVGFFIGATATGGLVDVIDPVTGILTYSALTTGVMTPLPDVWWEWDVDFAITAGTSCFVVYQEIEE